MLRKMECVVVSIGGSIVVPELRSEIICDTDYIQALAKVLKYCAKRYKLFVTVGGGSTARFYIQIGRKLGADEAYLDSIGIDVTRINAKLLIAALGAKVWHQPAHTFEDAINAARNYSIVVMGGTHPGHTTDAVAAMLAERVRARRLVNATSVDGIYTSDPEKNRTAKRLDKLSFRTLISLTTKTEFEAGIKLVFDPLAARIIARSKIPLLVLDGKNLHALRNAILGRKFDGSIVCDKIFASQKFYKNYSPT